MKNRKTILALMLTFSAIWFFQYFFSFWPGAYTIFVFLLGSILWLTLLLVGVVQVFRYVRSEFAEKTRLFYAGVIFCLLFASFLKPQGLINWEKYESEDILVAGREGTANCYTELKLKPNNIVNIKSVCFGIDIYSGKYSVSQDTIYLELEDDTPYINKKSFGVFKKHRDASGNLKQICVFQNMEGKRWLEMSIKKIDEAAIFTDR